MACSPAIVINYLYAKKKIKNGYDYKSKLKSKLLDSQYISISNLEYVALYALMGDKPNLLKYLKMLIKESPSDKYNVINWPLLEDYRGDEQIKSVLKPELCKCQIKF